MGKDNIYQTPQPISAFAFDETVARVFDDMISRSVPLYLETQTTTLALASRYALPKTCIYDLGCSTGTTLIGLAAAISDPSIDIVGVDNSKPMLVACKEKLSSHGSLGRVSVVEGNIQTIELTPCSVVIVNYTLQFLPPEDRLPCLRKIFSALVPGGLLILSEKVKHSSTKLHDTLSDLHHSFKRSNGYSSLEISQKRDAIENVLIPLTTEDNLELLEQAGFSSKNTVLKWLNFATFAAVKE